MGRRCPALYDNALWAMTVDGDTDYRRFLAVARMITDDAGNRRPSCSTTIPTDRRCPR